MLVKTCTRCHDAKPIEAFYTGRYECKPCWAIRKRLYRARYSSELAERARAMRAATPEKTKEMAYRWRLADPERYRLTHAAQARVHSAIQRGLLHRPASCEECGAANRPIEAAHFDYVHPLRVRWLCRPCHRAWDKAEPKFTREVCW